MYNPISNMRGLSVETIEQLQAQGVKYTTQLLEHGKTAQQRTALAQQSALPLSLIEELVGRADLMRLRGVGGDLSLLLREAGISSCRSLQHQSVEQLHKRLAEFHIGKHIAYHAPSKAQIRSWINEVQELVESSPYL